MDNALLKKLNYNSQGEVCILRPPDSFIPVLSILEKLADVDQEVDGNKNYSFVLAFAKMKEDISALFEQVRFSLTSDPVLWIAYPKKSSKKYHSDISRDSGWETLGQAGFEGVRSVAIDQDWTALRFRKVEFIKNMKRDSTRALSQKGRDRTGK